MLLQCRSDGPALKVIPRRSAKTYNNNNIILYGNVLITAMGEEKKGRVLERTQLQLGTYILLYTVAVDRGEGYMRVCILLLLLHYSLLGVYLQCVQCKNVLLRLEELSRRKPHACNKKKKKKIWIIIYIHDRNISRPFAHGCVHIYTFVYRSASPTQERIVTYS